MKVLSEIAPNVPVLLIALIGLLAVGLVLSWVSK